MGNLATPGSVQKLQTALHAKAKAAPGYRFYALYDKVYREDILAHAWAQCRSNQGAAGGDGQDFEAVEAYGVERWLGELALALRQETYRAEPIRRVFIPKANGKLRPLGISTLRDRVGMTAAMRVLDPIFDADLPPEQYAYRPGRSAQQAAVEVEATLYRGHRDVVDADLADYFGSIPHAELLKSVARRVVDRRVLHLIKMGLECAVEETDDRGRKKRTTEAKDTRRGIPQGSPISPLLSNIYLTEVDRMLERAKTATRYAGRYDAVEYVRFADDLVILVDAHPRHAWLRQAVPMRLRQELAKLQVEVNEEKSATVDLDRGESFGFLGFDFRRVRALSGAWRPQLTPKLKKRTALLGKLRDVFRRFQSQPADRIIELINPILRGWVNYFAVGHSSRCFNFVQDWVEKKIRRHMLRARKRRGFGWTRWSRQGLYETLGLFNGYRVRRGSTPKALPA